MPKSEKLEFQTEVSQLLKLMINSVYSEKEVFVRELVSNASDACDKLRYLSNTKEKLIKDDPNFKIQITINKKNNLITISDNGIGMNKEESDEILKKIFDHQARLDLTCRFTWTENAVCIWDNRSVIHYAIADFYPGKGLGHERVMDRIAIEGDHPQ